VELSYIAIFCKGFWSPILFGVASCGSLYTYRNHSLLKYIYQVQALLLTGVSTRHVSQFSTGQFTQKHLLLSSTKKKSPLRWIKTFRNYTEKTPPKSTAEKLKRRTWRNKHDEARVCPIYILHCLDSTHMRIGKFNGGIMNPGIPLEVRMIQNGRHTVQIADNALARAALGLKCLSAQSLQSKQLHGPFYMEPGDNGNTLSPQGIDGKRRTYNFIWRSRKCCEGDRGGSFRECNSSMRFWKVVILMANDNTGDVNASKSRKSLENPFNQRKGGKTLAWRNFCT